MSLQAPGNSGALHIDLCDHSEHDEHTISPTLTVTIQLTRTANCKEGLALVFLIWTELAFGAFWRDIVRVLSISEWEIISSAFSFSAQVGRIAERLRVAVSEELICADLKTIIGDIASLAIVDAARIYDRIPGKKKECER
jgi:hypothetical protein